jgi:hypothetical protein
VPDQDDSRLVRVQLTRSGADHLRALSADHREELARLAPRALPLWDGLET